MSAKPIEVEVAPDRSHCWVHFSHLDYGDFGRTECLDHWKIAKVFESARVRAVPTEMLNFNVLLREQHHVFILGMHYKMIPELWAADFQTLFPYKVSVEICDIGQTSLTLYSEMVNKLNDQTLASCACKIVYVDVVTRRPAPLPDWYVQSYRDVATRQKRPLALSRIFPKVPSTAHCYNLRPAASDTDTNRHVNQGSYMRFCCDAAQAALRAQALAGFQHDIARYPLIEHQVIYMGESDVGDQLQVYVWQPPDRTDKVLFLITRHNPDGQPPVLYQAYMVYLMKQIPRCVARL
ncbi:uncharacterized protein LOC143286171 isoform X2 [Babylonia areolata]